MAGVDGAKIHNNKHLMIERTFTSPEKLGMAIVIALALSMALTVYPGWDAVGTWLAGANASGWAQAVGTMLAIWGTFQISSRQLKEARRLSDRRQIELSLAALEVAGAIFAQAAELVSQIDSDEFETKIASSKQRTLRHLQSVIDSIRALPPLAIPAWKVATLVVSLPPTLQALHDGLLFAIKHGGETDTKAIGFRKWDAVRATERAVTVTSEHTAIQSLKLKGYL